MVLSSDVSVHSEPMSVLLDLPWDDADGQSFGFLEAYSLGRYAALFTSEYPPVLPIGTSVSFQIAIAGAPIELLDIHEEPEKMLGVVQSRRESPLGILYTFVTDEDPEGIELTPAPGSKRPQPHHNIAAYLIGENGYAALGFISDLSEQGAAIWVRPEDEERFAGARQIRIQAQIHRSGSFLLKGEIMLRRLSEQHVRYGIAFDMSEMTPALLFRVRQLIDVRKVTSSKNDAFISEFEAATVERPKVTVKLRNRSLLSRG